MASPILRFASRFHTRKMTTSTSNPSSPSPWLLLPPSHGGLMAYKYGGLMAYKFYSLADDKVFLLTKHPGGPDDEARVVGSSHGWLALMNRRNNDLFLSNPLSGRHIKLPPLDALPEPEITRHGTVSKLILSSSPDEEKCHAMMSFGPLQRLAICQPGRSREWSPVGGLFAEPDDDPIFKFARGYVDIVHSAARDCFTCLALYGLDDFVELEEWDPRIPRLDRVTKEALPAADANCGLFNRIPAVEGRYKYKWMVGKKAEELRSCERIVKHLACVEAGDDVYVLFRFVEGGRTVGFVAARVEKEEKLRLVGSCLEGLAVFVGTNNAFALSVKEFPYLKPNSIYFAPFGEEWGDIGIFDCVNGTFSSCCAFTFTFPFGPFPTTTPPIWFTPTLP